MVHVRVPDEAVVSTLWSRDTAALFELMVEADRARRERVNCEGQPAADRDDQDEDESPVVDR